MNKKELITYLASLLELKENEVNFYANGFYVETEKGTFKFQVGQTIFIEGSNQISRASRTIQLPPQELWGEDMKIVRKTFLYTVQEITEFVFQTKFSSLKDIDE